jgi:hypothetical protein
VAAWLGLESPGGDTLHTAYLAMHNHSERGVVRNVELQRTRAGGDPTSSDNTFATINNISQPVPRLPPGEPLTAVWDCVDSRTGMLLTAVCVSRQPWANTRSQRTASKFREATPWGPASRTRGRSEKTFCGS